MQLDELVVILVSSDPEPQDTVLVWQINAYRSIVTTNAGCPKPSNLFKMKRGIARVRFKEFKIRISKFLNI